MTTVKFTAMKDGDRDDYEFLTAHEIDYAARTGERLLDALVQLDAGLSGYKITRLGHSLQAATRAWRDGADTDWIACALLHDIGTISVATAMRATASPATPISTIATSFASAGTSRASTPTTTRCRSNSSGPSCSKSLPARPTIPR